MIFFRLSDSLEGVGHADVGVGSDVGRHILVLQCFDAIFKSLQNIVDTDVDDINDAVVDKIFEEFPYLEAADYEGIIKRILPNNLPSSSLSSVTSSIVNVYK